MRAIPNTNRRAVYTCALKGEHTLRAHIINHLFVRIECFPAIVGYYTNDDAANG
jgi:hypothetical protein